MPLTRLWSQETNWRQLSCDEIVYFPTLVACFCAGCLASDAEDEEWTASEKAQSSWICTVHLLPPFPSPHQPLPLLPTIPQHCYHGGVQVVSPNLCHQQVHRHVADIKGNCFAHSRLRLLRGRDGKSACEPLCV